MEAKGEKKIGLDDALALKGEMCEKIEGAVMAFELSTGLRVAHIMLERSGVCDFRGRMVVQDFKVAADVPLGDE